MVVDVQITTQLDSGLYDLLKGSRLWNLYTRAALRAELIKHHDKRIPLHFELDAHGRYGYAPRTKATKAKKKDYWKVPEYLDLVRSGQMKQGVKQRYDITFGGAFGGKTTAGTLEGRLNMYLPHPLLQGKRPGAITPDEIESEIVRVTDDEADDIARGYIFRLTQQVNAFTGPMRFLRKTKGGGASQFNKSGSMVSRVPIGHMPLGPGF